MSKRSPEYISGYQAGFVDGYFTDSEQVAPFVAILTDLIAELRNEHGPRPHPYGGRDMCQACGITFTDGEGHCPTWHLADRAEARLRGVQGE